MDQFVEKFREPYAELFLADHISAVICVQGKRPEPLTAGGTFKLADIPAQQGLCPAGETGNNNFFAVVGDFLQTDIKQCQNGADKRDRKEKGAVELFFADDLQRSLNAFPGKNGQAEKQKHDNRIEDEERVIFAGPVAQCSAAGCRRHRIVVRGAFLLCGVFGTGEP